MKLQGRILVKAWNNAQGEPKAAITFNVNSIKLHGTPKNIADSTAVVAPVSSSELTEPLDDLPF